jgi:hypothetical protein
MCRNLRRTVDVNRSRVPSHMSRMRSERSHREAGWPWMKQSMQYREFAEECLRLAKRAKTDQERAVLQEMAAAWLKLAEAAEQKNLKAQET